MPTKLSPKDLQQSALPHATAGSLKARLDGEIDLDDESQNILLDPGIHPIC